MYKLYDTIELNDGRIAQLADVLSPDEEFIVDIDLPQPDGGMKWLTDEISVKDIKKKIKKNINGHVQDI